MTHITFKDKDGRTFRIVKGELPGNSNIEQRFWDLQGNDFWYVLNGPNDKIRNLAFDAVAEAEAASN